MMYKATSSGLNRLIDEYRTGNYGEDYIEANMSCSHCGSEIRAGDMYFMLEDDVYCMGCSTTAEAHILRDVKDSYIYEL